jgi:hypothetical protein
LVLKLFKEGDKIKYGEAFEIIKEFQKYLKENVNESLVSIKIPKDGKIIIVGDLHVT